MSDCNNGYARPLPQSADMSVDAGLRAFMLGVYNKLAIGLVVAGALAYVTGNVPAVQQLLDADPLGCAEWLVSLKSESFRLFPFLSSPAPGSYGKWYERNKCNYRR